MSIPNPSECHGSELNRPPGGPGPGRVGRPAGHRAAGADALALVAEQAAAGTCVRSEREKVTEAGGATRAVTINGGPRLEPGPYQVLRQAATEPPGPGQYVHNHEDGTYRCAGCGAVLFGSPPSSTRARGGRAFTSRRRPKRSSCAPTRATAWSAPRSYAAPAAVIWAMSSTTGRSPRASAIASIRCPWTSKRGRGGRPAGHGPGGREGAAS